MPRAVLATAAILLIVTVGIAHDGAAHGEGAGDMIVIGAVFPDSPAAAAGRGKLGTEHFSIADRSRGDLPSRRFALSAILGS